FGNGAGQFTCSGAVAIDPASHNILITDFASVSGNLGSRVLTFTAGGVFVSQFIDPDSATVNGFGCGIGSVPNIAIDPTTRNIVFTGDILGNRVQIFSPAGTLLSQFGTAGGGNGQFNNATGVAVDPTTRNIIVADSGNNRVQIFSPA